MPPGAFIGMLTRKFVHAVGGAGVREVLEPPQLAERHPELPDEHVMQEAERVGCRTRVDRPDLDGESVRGDRGRVRIPQVFTHRFGVREPRRDDPAVQPLLDLVRLLGVPGGESGVQQDDVARGEVQARPAPRQLEFLDTDGGRLPG